MTVTDPQPHKLSPASPSLKLLWMQALIGAGAQLARPEVAMTDTPATSKDAVHYILCGAGPGTTEAGTDFLTAVAKARKLVAGGARRVVFLTYGDTKDGRLHLSLISFAHHAGRALTARPAEFAVVPIRQPLTLSPASDATEQALAQLRKPGALEPVWDSATQHARR